MAEIIALGLIGTAITLGTIGTVQNHNAAQQQAQNAEDSARMQQAQMEYNRRMEEREAAALEAETAENVRRQREESARLRSAQLAMLGKSGAAMASGSPLAILGATAADEEMKAQDMHYAGARSGAAHRSKAIGYSYGAAIAGQGIRAARASRPSGSQLALGIANNVMSTGSKAGGYAAAGTAIYNAGKSAYKAISNWLTE